MSENNYKEVYFNQYCPKCKHEKLPETDDICNDCMTEPVNLNSHKPVKFEEKEK